MIDRLKRDFVNTWVLVQNLDRLLETPSPHARKLLKRLRGDYVFPVDSLIYSPQQELIDHKPAKFMVEEDDHTARYIDFLQGTLEKHGAPPELDSSEAGS